jgi:hypothetical protein
MARITFNQDTSSEFFVGNLNKTKTRDEIFQDLTKIKIDRLDGENLYISKFNMPKFNARKDQDGNLLLNLGYAFVTTRKPEMAQELIEKKRMKLDDGSDIEFNPINKSKRLVANQNCKDKNISKINDVNGTRKNNLGAIGDWRNQSVETPEIQSNDLFGDLYRAPATIQRNDSFDNNYTWTPKLSLFENTYPENVCTSQSIFDCNTFENQPSSNAERIRRNRILSGSDKG